VRPPSPPGRGTEGEASEGRPPRSTTEPERAIQAARIKLDAFISASYRPITTPHAPLPAGIVAITFRVAASITETSLLMPLAV
jgi:hypothetical protein